jgi:ribosomal protein S18 acetylase RimI-like enzyme
MNIRKADLRDCESVSQLAKIPELKDALGNSVSKDYFEEIVKKNDYFFVAEENKKIVGFVVAEMLLGKIVFAQLLGVAEKCRGRGIGKNLLDKVKQKAREDEAKYLFLFAPNDNQKTIEFYKSLKFLEGKSYTSFGVELG